MRNLEHFRAHPQDYIPFTRRGCSLLLGEAMATSPILSFLRKTKVGHRITATLLGGDDEGEGAGDEGEEVEPRLP